MVSVYLGRDDDVYVVPSELEFEGVYGEFLSSVREQYPEAYIFVLNPLVGTTSDNGPKWENCKSYLQDVVAARNDGGDDRVYFVALGSEQDPWLDDPGDYSGDRTHPNPNGHAIIAERLKEFMLTKLDDELLAKIEG